MKGKKFLKVGFIAAAVILVVAGVGFLAWTRLARYPAFPEAAALAQTAQTPPGWYVFKPEQSTDTALVFYPGGLVDPAAYAPYEARNIAKRFGDIFDRLAAEHAD